MVVVVLQSAPFKRYVRCDASALKYYQGPGGGIANTQSFVGRYETYFLRNNPDGTVSFECTAFPNCYLRADGAPGGLVNCQFGLGPGEKFRIRHFKVTANPPAYRGLVSLELASWTGRYLKMVNNALSVQEGQELNGAFQLLVVGATLETVV